MKQSPIRRLRRDRSRLIQERALAQGTGDTAGASDIDKRIRELDQAVAAEEAKAPPPDGGAKT
jgi:hypothetical protein